MGSDRQNGKATQARLFPVRRAAHYVIRAYQLSLSALLGRHCRYLPTCSAYMDEAIARHGLGPGAIMGVARLCRCHPWGNHGFDPVPEHLPEGNSWMKPWRYGDWIGPRHCDSPGESVAPDLD
jgi:putative membrane protein insertion efficiency factor